MQDKLNMKRSIMEYDKEGNLRYSTTEYYSDNEACDETIPDIKVRFHNMGENGECSVGEADSEIEQTWRELDRMIFKLKVIGVIKTAARCFLYAAASFAAAKIAMKIKER